MKKIIWSIWFQGREKAPHLAQRCFQSWERENPDWDFRCLDASSVGLYIDLTSHVDLQKQVITAASLSDIVRILLLHEYGGVWVDATLFCNRPLDEWLPSAMAKGFFAFSAPAKDRPLASWFLACDPGHTLIQKWAARTVRYWDQRLRSNDYFWFHHLFLDLLEEDADARLEWESVTKISADGPHSIQHRMYKPAQDVLAEIDLTTPVFKLTYRIDPERLSPHCLLHHLLENKSGDPQVDAPAKLPAETVSMRFASVKVSTENLGDHIQIVASQMLLNRLGIAPCTYVDRDDEIATSAELANADLPVGILMNGWFKTNREEWPPHLKFDPIFLGFHIRLWQCPELVSPEAIEYYRRHGPIGCRDEYTLGLLTQHGVDAFISNCLSILFPRRLSNPEQQTEVFVVSRDERVLDDIPASLGPVTFVSHYSGSNNFDANMRKAHDLLETYRTRAKLIVTTLLHCALPAMAMGIPVIVFYPLNNNAGHASDRERFSSLERLVRVHHFNEIDKVDWNGRDVETSHIKLSLLDAFLKMSAKWGQSRQPAIGPLAPSTELPVPSVRAVRLWFENRQREIVAETS